MFAHQGGWDEALYVGIPVLGALWMLRISERRARSLAEREETEAGPPTHDPAEKENDVV